jgi:quercetin dioxygenase-like cupin family protein
LTGPETLEGEEHPVTEDKTVKKVSSKTSPKGEMGQKYLADGKSVSMRLWDSEDPSEPKPEARRDYETVGYVIGGRAELHLEGQMVLLEPGDSWLVPKGASHTYNILESFTAVEATSPPAEVHGRDEGRASASVLSRQGDGGCRNPRPQTATGGLR